MGSMNKVAFCAAFVTILLAMVAVRRDDAAE